MKLSMKVAVCVPSGDTWDKDFAMCLIYQFVHVLTRPMKGVKQISLFLINEKSSLLPKSRQGLLDRAIQTGCDYALFVDTDQTFPSNLLYRLLYWNKAVVACNIATKSIPASPTARNFNPNWSGGDVVFSDSDKHGLEEVWRIGTGVMLIDLAAIKNLPKPWFNVIWDEQAKEFHGEDWFFCQRLQEAGIKIYIDHDLSREVGHVGRLNYTHDLVGEVVKQEAAEIAKLAANG